MMATRRALTALLLLVVLGAGAVACSGGDDESFNTVGQSISGSAGDGVAGGEASEGADAGGTGATVPAGAEVPGVPREVIYTADLVVRVDDVEAAAERARVLVTDAGGYVGQQSADLEEGRHVTITLRVPAAAFDDVLGGITGLGEVLQRELDAQDVTDQVVDLEVRIANTEVSAQRLRELLAEADGVPNLLAIETELTNRETQIEQMKGQLQVLRDQVDLSTVTVRFTEERETDPEVADDLPGFVKAFRAGGVALANVGLVLLAAVGFALPFVPFVAAAWFGRRWWRRRHPKTPKSSAPPPGWPVWPPGGAAAAGGAVPGDVVPGGVVPGGVVPGGVAPGDPRPAPPPPAPTPPPSAGGDPVSAPEAARGRDADPDPDPT